jgi:hypothetical protein
MLYTALTLIGTVLLLTFVSSYIILRAAISEPHWRRMMLFFVMITPVVSVIAFARVLFSHPKPIRYNAELGRIEDEIESERVRTFGGKLVHPSFSERWKMSYFYAVEKSAVAAARLDPSFCKISNFR